MKPAVMAKNDALPEDILEQLIYILDQCDIAVMCEDASNKPAPVMR